MLTANAYAVQRVHQRVQDRLSLRARATDTGASTPWLNAVMVVDYQALLGGTKP